MGGGVSGGRGLVEGGVSGGRGLVRGRGKEVKDYGINSSNKPAMIDHMRLISFGLLFETT